MSHRVAITVLAILCLSLAGCGQNTERLDGHSPPPPPKSSAPVLGAADTPSVAAAGTLDALRLGGLTFAPPAQWKDLGASGMRKAQYELPAVEGDGRAAAVNVFFFGAGVGGDIEANIRRWIGQMKTPEGGDASGIAVRSKLTTTTGLVVHFVEVDGTYNESMGGGPMTGGRTVPRPEYRMVGAIVEGPGGNVFLKLTGPTATAGVMEAQLRDMVGNAHAG